MGKLRIVLVEPREAGNVGAAARAMKNFGFTELAIVGELPQLKPVAEWWASGAEDVVTGFTPSATLFDAVADAHLTISTSSARGRTSPADLTPAGVAQLFADLGDDQTLALVFGREDRGLTREEAMACQRTAVIPTNRDFPVMNLAQAVSLFCYELSDIPAVTAQTRTLAPAAMLARIHERLESLLLEIGFLHEENPDQLYDELRALAGRASLDEREATILLGIARQLEWRLRQ